MLIRLTLAFYNEYRLSLVEFPVLFRNLPSSTVSILNYFSVLIVLMLLLVSSFIATCAIDERTNRVPMTTQQNRIILALENFRSTLYAAAFLIR